MNDQIRLASALARARGVRNDKPMRRVLVALLILVGGSSCGSSAGGDGANRPTSPNSPAATLSSLSLTLSPTTIEVGQSSTATTTGKDQFGTSIATGTVTYTSSAPAVATLSGPTITAVGAGQATITATVAALSASATLTVQPKPVLTSLQVALSPAEISTGQTSTASATGQDQFGASIPTGPVTFTSGTPAVATVNGSTITGVSLGQSTITATAGSVTGSATLTVQIAKSSAVALCKLPAQTSVGVGLGFPRVPGRLKTTGDVHISMVFVDFPDAVSTRTPQSVFDIISPGAETFYRTISYGRMNLLIDPTFVWRRMSKASTQYGWASLSFLAHQAYIQEALNLADPTEFTNADGFAIIANPDATALANGPTFVASAGSGVTAGGKTFLSGVTSGHDLLFWGSYWLNHEMGHAMSLADLYAYTGAIHYFVGGFSLMGNIAGFAREYFAWERWQLGWIDDDQIWCDAEPGTADVALSPVERIGGTKLVVIPTGQTTAILVESRRAEGYDNNGAWMPGVLVYTIDTSVPSGNGVLRVQPINDSDISKASNPLQVGASITLSGVTVTFVSSDANGDRVRIVR
jgi:M6 family metalloprotease-like protein